MFMPAKFKWGSTIRALALALLASALSAGALSCTAAIPGQVDSQLAQSEEPSSARRPLQIGKLIKKRQIAPVMSVAHADWLTRPDRDAEEQPDRVVRALNIPKGATVVDLGAGVGYFTWRLAEQVGPQGRVIAVDIQQGMLDLLEKNLKERGITNVDMVLATQDNPKLPVGAVDLVLMVDVYHELSLPETTMRHVRESLKPDGRVVLIEYRKEDPSIPINPLHKMSVEEVLAEVEPLGFKLTELMNFLPTQHIFVFHDASRPKR
jgi:predicted methyltransferase